MATGRAQTRRATPRASHGNITGNAAIQLNKENAAAVRDAQTRMGMVNPVHSEFEDPISLDAIDPGAEQEAADRAAEIEATRKTAELSASGLDIKAHPRPRPRRMRGASRDGNADPNTPVVVVFNDDYFGVTLGKDPKTETPRNFDFEAGRPYSVPSWVADHFSDKEMLASVG